MNLPSSVYHTPNVLAGTDSTSYSRLHYLPESYITRYDWFAALLQYVAAGLLGDVAARPACGWSRIHQGSRDEHEAVGYDITLTRSDVGGHDRQRTPRRGGGTEPDLLPLLPAVRRARSGHILVRCTGERTWTQVRRRPRRWGEEDYTPVSPGGSASETSLRRRHRPCVEVSLRAGDLPLHTFASNVFKR
jgi:hypothetical protein